MAVHLHKRFIGFVGAYLNALRVTDGSYLGNEINLSASDT